MSRTLLLMTLGAVLLTLGACGEEEQAVRDRGAEDGTLPVGLPVEDTPTDGQAEAPGDGDGTEPDAEPDSPEPDATPEPDAAPEPDATPEPDADPGNPPVEQCTVWQECGPLYDDTNSGMECVQGTCQCDPVGEWAQTCTSMGGYWVPSACQCSFSDLPPPSNEPNANCWWDLQQDPCDPDRWIDTSHYEDQCYYDAYDEYRCDAVWVESGYYEDGACPAPFWIERC